MYEEETGPVIIGVLGLLSTWWSGKARLNDRRRQPCRDPETVSGRRASRCKGPEEIVLGVLTVTELNTKNFLHTGISVLP